MAGQRLHRLFILGLMLSAAVFSGCGRQETERVSLPEDGASSGKAEAPAPQEPELEYRPETETYCIPDGTAGWTCVYKYNEAGRLARKITTCAVSPDEEERETTAEYSYNPAGNVTEIVRTETWQTGGQSYTAVLSEENDTYDSQSGRFIAFHSEWDGSPSRDETYAYDDQGRKSSAAVTYYQIGDPGYMVSTISYTYDTDGRLLREETAGEWLGGESQWEADGTENECHTWQSWTDYTYDAAGKMTCETSGSDDGNRWGVTYRYNADGYLAQEEDDHGWRTEYVYDDDGNCIETRHSDENGTLHSITKMTHALVKKPDSAETS